VRDVEGSMTANDFIDNERIAHDLVQELAGLSSLLRRVQPVLDAADALSRAATQLGVIGSNVIVATERLDAAARRIPDLGELINQFAAYQDGLQRLEVANISHGDGLRRVIQIAEALTSLIGSADTSVRLDRIELQLVSIGLAVKALVSSPAVASSSHQQDPVGHSPSPPSGTARPGGKKKTGTGSPLRADGSDDGAPTPVGQVEIPEPGESVEPQPVESPVESPDATGSLTLASSGTRRPKRPPRVGQPSSERPPAF